MPDEKAPLTQKEINDQEWNNPDHWTDLGFYFSKKDSRIFVPKRKKWMGLAINLGHPAGGLVFLGLLILICIFIIIRAPHC